MSFQSERRGEGAPIPWLRHCMWPKVPLPTIGYEYLNEYLQQVLLHLASLLDVCSILRLTSTCKQLLGFGRDTFLWKMLLRRDLGVDMDCSMAYEDLVEEYKMRTRPPKITCCCSSPYFRSIEDFQPRRYEHISGG